MKDTDRVDVSGSAMQLTLEYVCDDTVSVCIYATASATTPSGNVCIVNVFFGQIACMGYTCLRSHKAMGWGRFRGEVDIFFYGIELMKTSDGTQS